VSARRLIWRGGDVDVKRFFLRLLYSSAVLAALIFLLGAPRKWGT
jgi:hypothetical protein